MKKIIYGFNLLLMLGMFASSSFAEEKIYAWISDHFENTSQISFVISPSLPAYYFEFGYSTSDLTGLISDKPILIRRGGNSAVLQILKQTDNSKYRSGVELVLDATMDLNRDGFKDIYLGKMKVLGGDYFLFNPKIGVFKFAGNFPELIVEPKTNRIYSQMHAEYRIYYKTDNLRITESTRVEIEEMPNGKLSRVTKEKVKGKWSVTKREVIKDNEPEF